MSEKKNSLLLTNVHDLYVLEDKISKKKFPSVCLSVCLFVWMYVRTWTFHVDTQLLSKELADPNKIWWVSSMYEM